MSRFSSATAIVAICFGYAALRYVVAGPVTGDQLPLFIANKGISMAAILALGIAMISGPLSRNRAVPPALSPSFLGYLGLSLCALHLVLSALILSPLYLPKLFYDNGQFTWASGLAILTGAIALVVMMAQAFQSLKPRPSVVPNLGALVLVLSAGHAALLGFTGWLQPQEWPASLPPITLVSFVIAVVGLTANIYLKTKSRQFAPARPSR